MRATPHILSDAKLRQYVARFNAQDRDLYPQHVPNARALDFLVANVPLFECPDAGIERTYHFRWWTFRKHIKSTPDGFAITEFLPSVPWAGKHNTIVMAAALHLTEGRWLRDPRFLDDYSSFWFRRGGSLRGYTSWLSDGIWRRALATGDFRVALDLLDDMAANYRAREREQLGPNGLFWQSDGADGGEVSIGGNGYRPLMNSAMYGDATAIARIAEKAGKADLAREFRSKAAALKERMVTLTWDRRASFFKVLRASSKADAGSGLADVRELYGYAPWFFGVPDPGYEAGWRELTDPKCFQAPFGPCFTERRHPGFTLSYEVHECQWNGPSWPLSTSITLTALANLLNDYRQTVVGKDEFFDTFTTYARSHRLVREDGSTVPWIDENLNPLTGDWIARTRLKTWSNGTWDAGKGGEERGKDYNHSTFCDLVVTGIAGLRPRADEVVEVNPLVPPGKWGWFCLDGVPYHGHSLTILWDADGKRYNRGKGLRVLADGKEIARSASLRRVTGRLP